MLASFVSWDTSRIGAKQLLLIAFKLSRTFISNSAWMNHFLCNIYILLLILQGCRSHSINKRPLVLHYQFVFVVDIVIGCGRLRRWRNVLENDWGVFLSQGSGLLVFILNHILASSHCNRFLLRCSLVYSWCRYFTLAYH